MTKSASFNAPHEIAGWDLARVSQWIDQLPANFEYLSPAFVALNREMTETDDPEKRKEAISLGDRFLNALEGLVADPSSIPDLTDALLARIFGVLVTVLVEAGPYRYETARDPEHRAKLEREALSPMRELRRRAVEIGKSYLSRPEFEPLGEAFRMELYPLLEGMLHPERYIPFRANQATKIADRLIELAYRLEDDAELRGAELTDDEQRLRMLLNEIYQLKYPRFGTSGLRGRWGEDFTMAKAKHVAQAICDYLRANDIPDFVTPRAQDLRNKWIVVGYDGRRNSEEIAKTIAQVCLANDFRVYYANRPTPTPALTFFGREIIGRESLAGILNCTASHNPPEWQGIKFNPVEGYPAPTTLTDIIAARANANQLLEIDPEEGNLSTAKAQARFVGFDPIVQYSEWLQKSGKNDSRIPLNWDKIAEYFGDKVVVIDPMHGAGLWYLNYILGQLGIRCEMIHAEADPDFVDLEYANPEPPYIEPLQEQVATLGAELGVTTMGLGTDTDADRFGIVGRGGEYFRPNQILAMLTRYLGVSRELKGRIVITQTGLPMIDKIAGMIPGNEQHEPEEGVLPAYIAHPFYQLTLGDPEVVTYEHMFVVPVGIKYIVEVPRMTRSYQFVDEEELPRDWMDELLLGGEESSGLTTRSHVPDKDGVWACLLIMDMMAYYSKSLSEIWEDTVRAIAPKRSSRDWDLYGGRVDIDASDDAKEWLLNYYLDEYKNQTNGDVKIADLPVAYLGGIRYDVVEIFFGTEDQVKPHYLRMRASGTEPLNRIYTESSDREIRERLERAALDKLDEFSVEVIESAYNLWRLADILAATEPSSRLEGAVVQKLQTEGWDSAELVLRLEKKRKHVEHRNKHVVDKWVDFLSG